MSNCLWELLVPAHTFNDGERISLLHHREFDRYVESIAGGLTIMKPVRGMWREETSDNSFHEPMIPIRIMCNKEQVMRIIDFTISHYRQKAVICYKLSDEVIVRYDCQTTKK